MATGPYPSNTLERLQATELEILCVFDHLCKEHDLSYWIDSGTLLGAVRHGGFIPWDDDVDVGMPVDDYRRLLELAPDCLPKGYSLQTCLNTPGQSALWVKLAKDGTRFIDHAAAQSKCQQAIFVDIFPYCPLASDTRQAQSQRRCSQFWQYISYLKHIAQPRISTTDPLRQAKLAASWIAHHTIAQLWTQRDILKHFIQCFDTLSPGNSLFSAPYPFTNTFSRDTLLPTREISFAGVRVMGPAHPEDFLALRYGDYLKLPPEEERYTHLPLILDFGDGINVMES